MIILDHFLVQTGGKRKEVRPRAESVAGRAWQVQGGWGGCLGGWAQRRWCESLGQTRISIAGGCSQEEARPGLPWSVLQMRIPLKVEGGQRMEVRPQLPLRAGLG